MEESNLQEKEVDIKQLVAEDKKRRVTAFKAYLENGLKEYNCGINPIVTITPKGVIPSIEIEAY